MTNKSTSLPPDNQSQPRVARILATAQFSGPLPPPQVLEHYERIVPGAADRIIAVAERQAGHRRQLESRFMTAIVANSRIGLVFGFLIGLGGLVAATVIAIYGDPRAGVGMGLLTLGSLVGVFVHGSRVKVDDRGGK